MRCWYGSIRNQQLLDSRALFFWLSRANITCTQNVLPLAINYVYTILPKYVFFFEESSQICYSIFKTIIVNILVDFSLPNVTFYRCRPHAAESMLRSISRLWRLVKPVNKQNPQFLHLITSMVSDCHLGLLLDRSIFIGAVHRISGWQKKREKYIFIYRFNQIKKERKKQKK